MTCEHIKVVTGDGICELHITRLEQKNALSLVMYQALAEHIEAAAEDDAIRALILVGDDGNFTSGNDLVDFANHMEQFSNLDVGTMDMPIFRFMVALRDFPKPVIAAVEGVAVGIGTTLLLHCDLVFARADARFKLPFTHLGLCPEYASSHLLPLRVGHAKASEWLLLGGEFSGDEACENGLVNRVIDDPLGLARITAATIVALAPAAVRQTKALLKQSQAEVVSDIMQDEIKAFGAALMGGEFREAVTAFFEKRAPDFSSFS